jgi:hypothetical protein
MFIRDGMLKLIVAIMEQEASTSMHIKKDFLLIKEET